MPRLKLSRSEVVALILAGALVLTQLLWPPMVGMADNGDFGRLMRWAHLEYATPDPDERFFNWINREYRFASNPWLPRPGFFSTALFFTQPSAIIGYWLLPGGRFDLRILGVVYSLGFLGASWLLMRGGRASARLSPLFLAPPLLLIFCDLGYAAYFHSFYTEPAAFIFLLALVGVGFSLAADERKPLGSLLGFCFFAALFIGARPANLVFAPFVTLFCARLFWIEREIRRRLILAGFALSLIGAAILLQRIAPWYANNGKYQSVFYGVLKDSPTPEQDLRALGLDEKFAVLANTTIFHPNLPIDIRGREFHVEFYERISHLKILRFYLTHPRRFIAKLELTSRQGFTVRNYAGNFEKSSGEPAGAKAQRWSLWDKFKQKLWPKSLWFFVVYSLLLGALIVSAWLKSGHQRGRLALEFCFTLWLMMLAAFVAPMLGDGESDLVRHLFLFNALFDLSLLALSALLLASLWRPIAALVLQSARQHQ
jgi:hypothetical protein